MKRVVAGVIGLAAGAAMLVGCSDDKATTAENSSSQSSAASQTSAVGAGGKTEVKVDGQELLVMREEDLMAVIE